MLYLEQHYLENSRRDLISKFNDYHNINELSKVNRIDLDFNSIKSKSITILGLCFFYLLTGLKGSYGFSSKKNLKKTIFCSLKLKNKLTFVVLEKYILIHLLDEEVSNIKFNKKSLSNTGTFSFSISDVLKLLDLDEILFRFRNLNNLKITLNFSNVNKKENFELLKSFGFFF